MKRKTKEEVRKNLAAASALTLKKRKTKKDPRKNLTAAASALTLKKRADLLPQDALFSQNFWESLSLEELAKAQGVKPMKDASDLIGTWPGEENDGFEEWIDELRHPGRKGSDRS